MTTYKRATALAKTGALALALALTVIGCSDSSSTEGSSSTASSGGFPVTVESAYGDITLDEKPERVVALGAQYVDMLVSIGIQPVAFTGLVPDEETFLEDNPWLDGRYESTYDAKLTSGDFKASPEAIAAYDPDLILGNIWNIDAATYEQISSIAPTFAGTEKDQATNWKDYLRAVGTLTGEEASAKAVVADVEAQFAESRATLAGLQGKTYNAAAYANGEFRFGGGTFLDDLGLTPAANQPAPFSSSPNLSNENLDQLAADVLLVGIFEDPSVRGDLEADPRFSRLPAVANGTVIFFGPQMANAATGEGLSSLSWLLEQVTPSLENSALNQAGQ